MGLIIEPGLGRNFRNRLFRLLEFDRRRVDPQAPALESIREEPERPLGSFPATIQ